MKFFLISDTHFNHANIATYCQRPANFTELIIRNCRNTIKPEDTVIHVGDVFIGKAFGWDEIRQELPGTWWLIKGNHDHHTPGWWCDHGFAFCADAMIFRGVWFTHKPASSLPEGGNLNIHGHLHNIWDGFAPDDPRDTPRSLEHSISQNGRLPNTWNRLFSVEYTNYMPIEMDKFIAHPDKYNARGPKPIDLPR